ncbi:ACB domain-containing protein [Plasmodiophora brassicae]|uniref:ACB domain-containing protein n=1 Tax=Plasmodiophora brassicae TaxID=37360 RepID=A0A0G4IYE6_PLABS|nr:hypothetical protein PBRA_008001 [Plasmodiophora brassicae]SPQ96528.1 unnamed protein product [Plasmodiophora brassicae]
MTAGGAPGTFDAAVRFVQSPATPSTKRQTNAQKLMFYALYKQATAGANTTPAPGRLNVVARAKWDAWKQLGSLSKDDAKKRYIAELDKFDPSWKKAAAPAAKL